MSLMSILLTSGASNGTWNPLKSPAEALRTASTADGKIDAFPGSRGSVKMESDTLNG
jgi:hypothetical protein